MTEGLLLAGPFVENGQCYVTLGTTSIQRKVKRLLFHSEYSIVYFTNLTKKSSRCEIMKTTRARQRPIIECETLRHLQQL
jgi:hypothetical protein